MRIPVADSYLPIPDVVRHYRAQEDRTVVVAGVGGSVRRWRARSSADRCARRGRT